MKRAITIAVTVAGLCWAAPPLLRLPMGLFVIGENDTTLLVIALLTQCLVVPIALVISVRNRRLAASALYTAAAIVALGLVDGERHLATKDHWDVWATVMMLLFTSGVDAALASFFWFTQKYKWPPISAKNAMK